MLATKTFFSVTEVPDPARHRDYNAWHQLDHRPENLALDGVRYGERWVLSPDCAAAADVLTAPLDRTHYVNMYWFADPVATSFAQWQELAERSFQWGRREDVQYARRVMMGTFSPVKGYVAPRVLVSPDALVFRPNRGIEITVSALSDPHSAATERGFAHHDRVILPSLLATAGVAGAWIFASQSTTIDAGWSPTGGSTTFDQGSTGESGQVRITLLFLDDDPLACAAELARTRQRLTAAESAAETAAETIATETVLLRSTLRAIEPWRWDWFDPR